MQIVANAVEGGASCAAYAPEIRSEGGSDTFTSIHSVAVNVANHHVMRNVIVIRNEREIAPNFCQLWGTRSSTQALLIKSSKIKKNTSTCPNAKSFRIDGAKRRNEPHKGTSPTPTTSRKCSKARHSAARQVAG